MSRALGLPGEDLACPVSPTRLKAALASRGRLSHLPEDRGSAPAGEDSAADGRGRSGWHGVLGKQVLYPPVSGLQALMQALGDPVSLVTWYLLPLKLKLSLALCV